ncbi:unnamed protein product [Rotaria sp. Silwood1]|nr:unnamed protein product [Rotaria sp. Silwood1]
MDILNVHPITVEIDENLYTADLIYDYIWVFENDERYTTQLITATVNHKVEILYFINYEDEAIEHPNEHIVTIESACMSGENCTYELIQI